MPTRLSEPGKEFHSPRKIKRPKGSRSTLPWEAARRDYTEGIPRPGATDPLDITWPTLDQIATRYGIKVNTVRNKSGTEMWSQQRRSNMLAIEVQRKNARAKLLAAEGKQFDTTMLNIAKIATSTIQARLVEIARSASQRAAMSQQMMEAMQRGELVDLSAMKSIADFDSKEMEQIANAASKFEEIGRRVLGDPSVMDDYTLQVETEAEANQTATNVMAAGSADRLVDLLSIMHNTGLYEQLMGSNAPELEAGSSDEADDDEEENSEDVDQIIDAVIVDENVPQRRTWGE